jgi:hypothetical protein
MKQTKQKLIDHLECYGLDISKLDNLSVEWWADEIWELKSHWSPNKFVGYITALVAPMHDGHRKNGQAVWAYGLSKNRPQSIDDAQSLGVVPVGKPFKNDIGEFIDSVIELKNAVE